MSLKNFWMSFVADGKFVGACIVEAEDVIGAVKAAWTNKCNPGGEVMSVEIPSSKAGQAEIARWGRNRLLTESDLRGAGYAPIREQTDDPEGKETGGRE